MIKENAVGLKMRAGEMVDTVESNIAEVGYKIKDAVIVSLCLFKVYSSLILVL